MLIDSHCHLDFPDFADDLDGVLSRAKQAGIAAMLTISTRIERFDSILALAERFENVFCSVGTHPHNAAQEPNVSPERLVALAENPKVIAIGEAGLDYHYDRSPREVQRIVFVNHIEAARKSRLPLVIHARDADQDMIDILREESEKGNFPFVLHCFSSGRELALAGIELGGYVSFSGIAAFRNSEALRSIAREIPLDRLLVETDAPYLAPPPHRGKRNEPAYVAHTAKALAEARGIQFDALAEATTDNFFRLFSKASASRGRIEERARAGGVSVGGDKTIRAATESESA